MHWDFASVDGRIKLSLESGNAQSYGVLMRSGAATNIVATNLSDTVRELQLGLAGQSTMRVEVDGPSTSPTSLRLTGSDETGALDVTLLPVMNPRIEDIVEAYKQSYAVFTIAEDNGVARCIEAIQGGPTLNAHNGTIGLTGPVGFNYKVPRNQALPDEVLVRVCQGSPGNELVTLNLPRLNTEIGTSGPVIIQFVGEAGHFKDPPFREPHGQIMNVFYEEYQRQCLTIQYSNSGDSQHLNFNHGTKRGHKSVIIIPNAL